MASTRYRPFSSITSRPLDVNFYDALGHNMGHTTWNKLDGAHESVMTDVVGSPLTYNAVSHRKLYFERKLERVVQTQPGFGVDGWTMHADPYLVPAAVSLADIDSLFTLGDSEGWTGSTRQQFINDSFYGLTEAISRQLDIFNLLRDLITVKGLADQMVRTGFRLLHSAEQIYDLLRLRRPARLTVATLRELLRQGSNSYLINQFGIQPMIGEIYDLFHRLDLCHERLKFLRTVAGKTYPAHFSRTVVIPHSGDTFWYSENAMWGAAVYFTNVKETVTYTASASIKCTFDRDALEGLLAEFVNALSVAGINRWAEFVWDLVPWSFVINIFANVSKWIRNNLTRDLFGNPLAIQSGGISYKSTFTADVEIRQPWFENGRVHVGTVTVSDYQRTPGFAWDYSIYSRLPEFTPTQRAILVAVVGQRLPR